MLSLFPRSRWKAKHAENGLAVILPPKTEPAWILNKIGDKVSQGVQNSMAYHCDMVEAHHRTYFYTHFSQVNHIIKQRKYNSASKHIVFFTHSENFQQLIKSKILSYFDLIVCMNSNDADRISSFYPDKKVAYAICGVDENFFPREEIKKRYDFLTVSRFYPRKNPRKYLSIVKANPKRSFALAGSSWEEFDDFQELSSLPNFTYIPFIFEDLPNLYNSCRSYLNVSELEGGPIPLLEAHQSGLSFVSAQTGFAPDILKSGDLLLDQNQDRWEKQIESFDLPQGAKVVPRIYDWSELVKIVEDQHNATF